MYKPNTRRVQLTVSALALSGLFASQALAGAPELTPQLEQAFQQAGWDAQYATDGSLILRRSPQVEVAGGSAEQSPGGASASAVWKRLRSMGWRVEKDAAGATLLYPPTEKKATAEAQMAAIGSETEAADKSLDQLLEQRGWRVERAADGALTLYPQAEEIPSEPPTKPEIEPAQGYVAAAEVAEIDLPVNRWGEAKRIAESWLKVFGNDQLRVGKIRKVLRVYLVSIVEANPPHALRHQISVNTSDGRVVVLN